MGDDILVGLPFFFDSELRIAIADFMLKKFNYVIDSKVEPSYRVSDCETKLSSFLRYRLQYGLPLQAG